MHIYIYKHKICVHLYAFEYYVLHVKMANFDCRCSCFFDVFVSLLNVYSGFGRLIYDLDAPRAPVSAPTIRTFLGVVSSRPLFSRQQSLGPKRSTAAIQYGPK